MQTQPVNDLDAVLGRFQAWTGSRTSDAVQSGVRELSVEEALRSRRSRAPRSSLKKELGPEPGVVPVEAPVPEPERLKAVEKKVRAGAKRRARTQAVAKKPEFREVLAKALPVTAQPVALVRPTAISIRLASSERALVKTRAVEAGVSTSAYVRQCVLEVEQLRAQVQQTLAAMERRPVNLPAPGLFARLVRRCWPHAYTRSNAKACLS